MTDFYVKLFENKMIGYGNSKRDQYGSQYADKILIRMMSALYENIDTVLFNKSYTSLSNEFLRYVDGMKLANPYP
jgi:hypothetical protein